MKFIASVSFGKDSLAMLLRLLEENMPLDYVVYYNTGMEFDSIYAIRDRVKSMLANTKVQFVELSPSMPFLYAMFDHEVKERKGGSHFGYGWCGGNVRWATRPKIQAIHAFKKSLGEPTIDYVGIAADEPERFEKEKADGKILPLVKWGMTEQDCLRYCHERGWFWNELQNGGTVELYGLLDRVSCWCCRNKNLKELRNIYHYLPDYWERLKDLQSKIAQPMKGENQSVFDLECRFKMEDEWISSGRDIKSKVFFEKLGEELRKENHAV